MEPSHLPKYSRDQIELIAAAKLQEAFPQSLSIPVDIDLVAEKQSVVDTIYLLPELQKKFNVAAVTTSKPNKKCDIILDENTNSVNRRRANFSLAHELGHIVLHESLYLDCHTMQESIELSKRLKKSYKSIERNANYFAGAILIPRRTIFKDIEKIYNAILTGYAGDIGWNEVMPLLYSSLANRYQVSVKTMTIRLEQLKIDRHINKAFVNKLNYIPWD
jgi:Zn-dependent peptidase ImmA (M78 family)